MGFKWKTWQNWLKGRYWREPPIFHGLPWLWEEGYYLHLCKGNISPPKNESIPGKGYVSSMEGTSLSLYITEGLVPIRSSQSVRCLFVFWCVSCKFLEEISKSPCNIIHTQTYQDKCVNKQNMRKCKRNIIVYPDLNKKHQKASNNAFIGCLKMGPPDFLKICSCLYWLFLIASLHLPTRKSLLQDESVDEAHPTCFPENLIPMEQPTFGNPNLWCLITWSMINPWITNIHPGPLGMSDAEPKGTPPQGHPLQCNKALLRDY